MRLYTFVYLYIELRIYSKFKLDQPFQPVPLPPVPLPEDTQPPAQVQLPYCRALNFQLTYNSNT